MPSTLRTGKSTSNQKKEVNGKMKPSELYKQSAIDVDASDYPMIVDFVNIQDSTAQVHSVVEVDRPLFQPSPTIVVFEEYAPFATHEQKIFFRNNDKVPRRIKIPQPDSQYFEVLAPRCANGDPLRQNKIAAGMEIYFTVKFKPQEVRYYSLDLICVTEREKFLVPVRAVGNRPNLNFPDEIHFGQCPVKSSARKMILVQNVGVTTAKLRMTPSHPAFSCTSEELTFEPGSSQMIEIYFTPNTAVDLSADIEVEYSKSLKCYIAVTGSGKNVEVSLSTPSLTLEPAYISLLSQNTLRIKNNSDITIKFAWKSYAKLDEEEGERSRLYQELDRMEKMEHAAFEEGIEVYDDDDQYGTGIVDDSEGSLSGDEQGLSHKARAAKATLIRKYRNLRRALELDQMHFVDDIFDITPVEGSIYPKSECEIACTFRPDTAAHYTCTAYLDVSGREDRLSLGLAGRGIGPHAALSFDVLDLGDIFINQEQSFEMSITNKGDIPAQWSYVSSLTKFGSKFTFTPRDGLLEVGNVQPIKLYFASDVLGEFSEYFRFGLQGNEEPLMTLVKGNVIGPTFHFDCKSIDFGAVSFDYLHSRTVCMVNTSKIPMTFRLRIPQDGTYAKKEFEVTPSEGILAAGSHLDVLVEFIPTFVKAYSYTLAVDVIDVGDMLLSIPITAECFSASLRLQDRDVKYGDCFIRYPYVQELVVINTSDVVYTSFKVVPQQQYTKTIACYDAEPSSGVVAPGDKMAIKVRLTAEKLGTAKVPILVSVAGSQEPPIQAALVCNAIGPRVTVDLTEIRWGNMECLKDFPRTLKVTNESLIPASMKLFLKNMRSKFDLSSREATLAAGETLDLVITANLDDTVVHNEELHILVHEGEHMMVPLSARGVGTTMYCKQDITTIDFGTQLTSTNFEKRIVLENKGRRHQALRWTNQTITSENYNRAVKLKKLGKDISSFRMPKDLSPVEAKFTVTPIEITLRPRTAVVFIFRGCCNTVGRIEEIFELESRIGKERHMKTIMTARVVSDIVDPLLHYSANQVDFIYKWVKDEKKEELVFKKDITLTNKSAVTLQFLLKSEMPFNLNSWDHVLSPGQSVDITVEFLPFYRDDKMSHVIDKLLSIAYRGHPQKDSIILKGEVIYPNLEFEQTTVNFGCVLNETAKTVRIRLTNTSKVPAAYEWLFLEDDHTAKTMQQGQRKKKGMPPLSTTQIFDILPIRSVLAAGANEDVEFVMFGYENNKFSGQAICVVEGGPEYTINLKGESSTVSYALDKNVLNFGHIIYNEKADQELFILNQGLVAFNFEASPLDPSSPGIIDVLPALGKVAPGEKLKLTVRMRPWQPDALVECIQLKVAHFDAVKIMCYCQAIFPSIVATLPRHKIKGPFGEEEAVEEHWTKFVNDSKAHILTPDKSRIPPEPDSLPPPACGTSAFAPSYTSTFNGNATTSQQQLLDDNSVHSTESSPSKRSTRSPSRGPSQLQIEVEMQRRVLCHRLAEKVDEFRLKTAKSTANSQATGMTRRENNSIQFLLKTLEIRTITMATYACDFGNIIMTTNKKRIFKIANAATAGPISWVFDKRLLSGTGFMIEPEKVSRLPEGASADFVVKFTAEKESPLGDRVVLLPLYVKEAPRVNIVLTAHVCIPEVEISANTLDFENLYLGCSRKMFFFLTNKSPVTASWKLQKANSNARETSCFLLEKDHGVIAAGKRVVIGVEFLPSDARRYTMPLTLRVDMNMKTKTLQLLGEGLAPLIRFDPPVLELEPVLPFTQGTEKVVTIFNDSGHPFEIYSQDFDLLHKEEEAMLLAVDVYDADGLYRSSLREAGEGPPMALVEAYNRKNQAQPVVSESANAVASLVSEEGEAGSVFDFPDPPIRRESAPRDNGLQQDIILIGLMISGVSTHGKALASKLQLPLKTVDGVIEEVANVSGAMGQLARLLLNRQTPDESAARRNHQDELLAAAEKSKAEVIEHFKKDKKNKKGAEVPQELLQTAQVIAYNAFLEENKWTAAYLADLLKFRLAWDDCGYGIVIDSFDSKLVDTELVVPAVKLAIPRAIIGYISVSGGEAGYCQHLAHVYSIKTAQVERITAILNQQEAESKPLPKSAVTKDGREKSTGGLEKEITIDTSSSCLKLMGDEFWYDARTGLVSELDKDEIKTLEDDQKELYLEMLFKQYRSQLEEAMDTLRRLDEIWSESGLKGQSSDGGAKRKKSIADMNGSEMYYWKFTSKILPLIRSTFHEVFENGFGFLAEGEGTLEGSIEDSSTNLTASLSSATKGTDFENIQSASTVSEGSDRGVFTIEFEAEDTLESVFDTINALLPAPKVTPPDKDALPLPSSYQVVRKPLLRSDRKHIDRFELLSTEDKQRIAPTTPLISSPEPAGKGKSGSSVTSKSSAKSDVSKNRKQSVAVDVEVIPPPVADIPKCRWVIPAFGSITFKVRFKSEGEGEFRAVMGFEVTGTYQTYTLPCLGRCEVPHIQNDPRNTFMRRVKSLPIGAAIPQHRFIMSDNYFSFGPLLKFKSAEWRQLTAEDNTPENKIHRDLIQGNFEMIRISNNGRYKCTVDLGFELDAEEVKDIFFVEPSTLEFEEGETKDVKIWAFPKGTGEFKNNLIACVSNNPKPVSFEFRCIGVEPVIDVEGPWTEAIHTMKTELDEMKTQKVDPKKMKELETKLGDLEGNATIDFDRQLLKKEETRTFEMTNSSLLPVAWEIDPEEFKDSQNVSIFPQSGVLAAGASLTLSVSVTSPTAMMITGKFSLKYSDAEGGLQSADRVRSKHFRITAEVYSINAVSLSASGSEEGGNEVDFGLMRVGDLVHHSIRMGNKGKYQIGYRISFRKAYTANLITIDPMEGTIDPGQDVPISLVFCAKLSEVKLKGNKDIRVAIFEPVTGEVVEEFPISVATNAKYNRFRMQPAKGISFGAVRFDSDTKKKSIELRNEGQFEITYVVTAAASEHNEFDTLDGAALSCFAYNTPAAVRASILGEDYLERMLPSSRNNSRPASRKDDKKKSHADDKKKSGGGTARPSTAPAHEESAGPETQDPDSLKQVPVPKDTLSVGAFTTGPRVGYVQPGETAQIDITFNPSGYSIAKEKLKFFIAGADMADIASQIIQSFEVTGESCFPAIVTEDMHSIFEEQEVVSSLSDMIGGKGDGQGSVKVDHLPPGKVIFAEAEKTLAFGPVICNPLSTKGVVERVKITNPTKIDTKVRFRLATQSNTVDNSDNVSVTSISSTKAPPAKGKKEAEKRKMSTTPAASDDPIPETIAFTVQPESWDIPPHEYRYVNIFFAPTEIKNYKAMFTAEVDEEVTSSKADTKALARGSGGRILQFDVVGSGTMPCVSVDSPTERDENGHLALKFGRVHVMRSSKKVISIRNHGILPSTCLFEVTGASDFLFQGKGSSVTLQPSEKQDLVVDFSPTKTEGNGALSAVIKMTVLNNSYDQYYFKLTGTTYACDALIDVVPSSSPLEVTALNSTGEDKVVFGHINITSGPKFSQRKVILKSRADCNIRFEFKADSGVPNVLSFSPSVGHLGPMNSKEITITFTPSQQIKLDDAKVNCVLRRIQYAKVESDGDNPLHGNWDESMKSIRPASEADLLKIAQDARIMEEYNAKHVDPKHKAAPKKVGKPGDSTLPPPTLSGLTLLPTGDDISMVCESVLEPTHTFVPSSDTQTASISCVAVADVAKFKCEIPNSQIPFRPTFLFQSASYSFPFINECNISLPVKWQFENMKRKAPTARTLNSQSGVRPGTRLQTANAAGMPTVPCPFSVEPEDSVVPPMSTKQFTVRFMPIEVDDFIYLLRGESLLTTTAVADVDEQGSARDPMRFLVRGNAKRPVCHFDIVDSPDYLTRRGTNLKNENGVHSPIEATDIRVVEVESTGLRSRNTFRFYVINPTNENYEFLWEAMGDPNPAWRCVLTAGMLLSGKRVEMIFEFLPEEMPIAESFYKFKIVGPGLEQIFLFAGSVNEPKVSFSTSKVDFHSVLLGGEGGSETIYLENHEHLMFNYAFDKTSLVQLEGTSSPILDISPKTGSIPPHGKAPITLTFKPEEEVVYNFNIICEVKRKPKKLSLNVKGEGYAVHPVIRLEQDGSSGAFANLRTTPAVNYLDFGSVQVLDAISKRMTVSNAGKYNFDYIWDTDSMGGNILLTGAKLCGTLQKGAEVSFNISFAPQRETSLDGASLSFTVAGKYTYNIVARGAGVKPALRFSFLHHDFGNCFVTSPGGNTVIEETVLQLVNQDTSAKISVECLFQKTRALWAECQPKVIDPGEVIDIPIRFAPREVMDYNFTLPFVVNGTTKVNVVVEGNGINPRLELVNQGQRRLNFGLVHVNTEVRKTVLVVNRSKKALPVQIQDDGPWPGNLKDLCVSYSPTSEFVVQPKESVPIQIVFNPTHRIGQFSEDLNVSYGGIVRKLITVSGKAQGTEVSLDTDSMPFGSVVLDSQKVRKLRLDNTGDFGITYEWVAASFGPFFNIAPLSGKLPPGTEASFDVTFRPQFVDDDIRQENMTLLVSGMQPLTLTCSGKCVPQPAESVQTLKFESLARKAQDKSVKISNSTDKDWFISPTLEGVNWTCPSELKVPAKGSADLIVKYFPLTMEQLVKVKTPPESKQKPPKGGAAQSAEFVDDGKTGHRGKVFVALPDGTALSVNLIGYAGPPELSGTISVETPAKKPATFSLKLNNWIAESQTFTLEIDITEKPSPATFIVAANAVEVGPNGTKDFNARFSSFTEGVTKATLYFRNNATGEYCFYNLVARTTTPEILETIHIESPVRQTARFVIAADNPLPRDAVVTMGSGTKPAEWWSCDTNVIRLRELIPFSGNSEGSFELEYRPLIPTSKQPKDYLLTIMSKDLGTFKYKVTATATAPSLRQTLRFEVPLGSTQLEHFLFKSYNPAATTFNCTMKQHDIFSLSKTLHVEAARDYWEGMEVKLPITFEPTEIGEITDVLTVTSPDAGEYVCEIVGSCTPPLPQGPYNFSDGSSLEIPFRNCFPTNCKWVFSVDSPYYKIGTPSLTVNAKTSGSCSVTFEPVGEAYSTPGGTVTAKLFIRCETKADLPPWVYYLRGKVDPNASQPGSVAGIPPTSAPAKGKGKK